MRFGENSKKSFFICDQFGHTLTILDQDSISINTFIAMSRLPLFVLCRLCCCSISIDKFSRKTEKVCKSQLNISIIKLYKRKLFTLGSTLNHFILSHSIREEDKIEEVRMTNASNIDVESHGNQEIGVELVWGNCGIIQWSCCCCCHWGRETLQPLLSSSTSIAASSIIASSPSNSTISGSGGSSKVPVDPKNWDWFQGTTACCLFVSSSSSKWPSATAASWRNLSAK